MKVPAILDKLRDAPIGARDGLIPLILALYMAAKRNETALFEEGTYLPASMETSSNVSPKNRRHSNSNVASSKGGNWKFSMPSPRSSRSNDPTILKFSMSSGP